MKNMREFIRMVINPILTTKAINCRKESSYSVLKSRLLLVTLLGTIMITSVSPNVQNYGVNTLNYVFAQGNLTSGLQQFEFNEDLQTALPNDDEQDDSENAPEQASNEESQTTLPEEHTLEEQSSSTESTLNENNTLIIDPSDPRLIGEVELTDLKTIPQEVRVGDEFKIQATIKNGLNEPITYTGKTCGESPLNVKYDDKVTVTQLLHCNAISTDTLAPNEMATVESRGYEIATAISPGTSNVDVDLYYNAGNSPNQGIVTRSFSFDVNDERK
ncbi:hypothetical protein [Candidatus Nitrosocosmicus sp. T]